MDSLEQLVTLDTQDGDKQSKKHNAENWSDEQHGPHHKHMMGLGSHEGQAVPASYEVPAMLLILSWRDWHHYTQTNTNSVNKIDPYYKQLEGKTNWTSFLYWYRNEHCSTELST